ncbi:MAG: hypothetical protein QXP70_03030 [Methanomassiliicoccales archaeon]
MGKFSGFVFGTMAAVLIAYYLLSPSFSPLSNWLSPYFGSGLSLILGLVYLLLGNPVTYQIVIVGWVVIGAVIGLSTRRMRSAIVSSLLVYIACWTLIFLGIAAVIFVALPSGAAFPPSIDTGTTSSIFSSPPSIPLPPPKTNLLTIVSEPVILQLFMSFYGMLPSLGLAQSGFGLPASLSSGKSGSLFATYALPYLLSVLADLAILLISASVVAYYSNRLRRLMGRKGEGQGKATSSHVLTMLALVVAFGIVLSAVFVSPLQSSFETSTALFRSGLPHPSQRLALTEVEGVMDEFGSSGAVLSKLFSMQAGHDSRASQRSAYQSATEGAYDEIVLHLISSDGNLYSGYLFASNYTLPQANVPGNNQVGTSLLLISYNLSEMPFQILSGITPGVSTGTSFSSLSVADILALIPPVMLIVSVNAGTLPAQRVAQYQLAYYSRITGEQFFPLIELPGNSLNSYLFSNSGGNPSSTSNVNGSIFVYAASSSARRVASSVSSTYLPSLQNGGLIESLSYMLSSGVLLESGPNASAAGLLALGYTISPSLLPQSAVPRASEFFPSPVGGKSFCMGLFYRGDFIFGGGQHTIPFSALDGPSAIGFSPAATTSALLLLTPAGYTDYSISAFPKGFVGTVFTDSMDVIKQFQGSQSNWTIVNMSVNSTISPLVEYNFTAPLPPEVVISSHASAAGHTITLEIHTWNLGNIPVNNLSIHFPGIPVLDSNFSTSMEHAFYANKSALAPGQAAEVTFVFNVPHAGVYVLPKVEYSFSAGGHLFSLESSLTHVDVGKATLFSVVPDYLATVSFDIVSHLVAGATYAQMLDISYALLAFLMVLAIYSEIRSFRSRAG